jgi:hypothetical protein
VGRSDDGSDTLFCDYRDAARRPLRYRDAGWRPWKSNPRWPQIVSASPNAVNAAARPIPAQVVRDEELLAGEMLASTAHYGRRLLSE